MVFTTLSSCNLISNSISKKISHISKNRVRELSWYIPKAWSNFHVTHQD